MVTAAHGLLFLPSWLFPATPFSVSTETGGQLCSSKRRISSESGRNSEDLAALIAIVKARIAKQKSSMTLEHHWQVACVRNRFRDFQRRVEQLYQASEENLEEAGKDSELAWKDLQLAVAALVSALPSRAE